MPGLLNRAAPGAAPGAPAAPNGQAPVPHKASPERQQLYASFVKQALNMIYDQKVAPQIMDRLTAAGSPIEGLANTTVMIVQRVMDAAQKANAPVDESIGFNAGLEIMVDLADFAKEAGVHEYTPDEVAKAVQMSVQLYAGLGSKSPKPPVGQPPAAQGAAV